MSTDTFQSSLYNDEKAMAHSNGWSDECNADRDEARNVENLRRVRASRREQPWATRVTPPDPWTDPCFECGCRLEESEGTRCEGSDGKGCGLRLCSLCAVSRVIEVEAGGETAKTVRILCRWCSMVEVER